METEDPPAPVENISTHNKVQKSCIRDMWSSWSNWKEDCSRRKELVNNELLLLQWKSYVGSFLHYYNPSECTGWFIDVSPVKTRTTLELERYKLGFGTVYHDTLIVHIFVNAPRTWRIFTHVDVLLRSRSDTRSHIGCGLSGLSYRLTSR